MPFAGRWRIHWRVLPAAVSESCRGIADNELHKIDGVFDNGASSGKPPTSKVRIDNVNRELVPKIRAALGVREYIQIPYRGYLLSDPTEPAYGPIEFELREVQMIGASLTGTVMVHSPQNRRFPKLNKNYDTCNSRVCSPGDRNVN
jgi:hypothetical protein